MPRRVSRRKCAECDNYVTAPAKRLVLQGESEYCKRCEKAVSERTKEAKKNRTDPTTKGAYKRHGERRDLGAEAIGEEIRKYRIVRGR